MKTTGYNSIKSYGIVVACSAIFWVITMPHRMSGLLFVAFTERYLADRRSASLPTTIYTMLKCFGGPLAAYLAEIIGIRNVTIIGCLLSALGVGSCFFAESMTEVTICLGLVFGVGLFLGNSLMPQMLKLHFNENIANANGLMLAGSCLGAFIHPPVIKYLLREYGLSGTFLLASGLMLNGVPIAMLLHDPKYPKVEVSKSETENLAHCRISSVGKERFNGTEGSKTSSPILHDPKYPKENGVETSKSENKTLILCRTPSVRKERFSLDENWKYPKEDVMQDSKSEIQTMAHCRSPSIGKECFNHTEDSKSSSLTNRRSEMLTLHRNSATEQESVNQMGDSKRTSEKFAMCGNGLEYFNQTSSISQLINKHEPVVLSANALTEKEILNQISPISKVINLHKPVVDISVPTFQKYKIALRTFLVFKDPPFLVYMLCFSLHLYIVVIMWVILMAVTRDKGLADSLEVYYLMLLPVAEIIGNSCFGWMTDYGYLTKSNYTGICFILLGVSCAMLAWAHSFATVMFSLLCFGVFTDATGICAPGLAYQFMDESKQTMAIASRYVLYAPLSFSAAPVIGYFRGTLGSYDGVLYMLTCLSTFSGILMMTLPYIAKCSKPKKMKDMNIVIRSGTLQKISIDQNKN